jgi:N-acetylglucosamine transport system substrate-binding protein
MKGSAGKVLPVKPGLTRRNFIQSSALIAGSACLAACGDFMVHPVVAGPTQKPTTGADSLGAPFEISGDSTNPLNMPEPVTAEGVFFSGGFGQAYIGYAANLFARMHPGSSVTIQYVQGVGEALRPRFAGGNPPDIIDNSGTNNLDVVALYHAGQLLDLAPLMNAASLDTPGKTVAETLFPKSQAGGVMNGRQVMLNIACTMGGIWYSTTLFEEKGWVYPGNWEEMLALCETIKSAGISPWVYQGNYPSYMEFGVLQGLIYKRGGMQSMIDIDNLADMAWYAPAVVDSIKELYTLVENEYILPDAESLSHTEAQAAWLKGNAAFIPCGNWLENEMKGAVPENFDMGLGEAPGEGHAILAEGSEPFIVPAEARNAEAGMEFLRCLVSKESARYFAEQTGAMMPVMGGTEGVKVTSAIQSAVGIVEACGENVFPFMRYGVWYSEMGQEASIRLGEMLAKKITPEQFLEAVQTAADQVKANPKVTKFTRTS